MMQLRLLFGTNLSKSEGIPDSHQLNIPSEIFFSWFCAVAECDCSTATIY